MLDAVVMVKTTKSPEPENGTFPVPVQPVQTYCVPAPPKTGEVTDSVMLEPESNQPLFGVGECTET